MPRPAPVVESDDVDWMIIEHAGDMRAALETAMIEIERLRHELALASLAVSSGFTRGWQPTIATDGHTQG
ncbi:MAG: dehydrogenase [Aliihoeflea sp.]|uniref:dehydrogenase n=1 Tax=Aliihoeflea sp. TaxID=2608088 RepID=UPI0040338FD8